jgi:hypothetical protein
MIGRLKPSTFYPPQPVMLDNGNVSVNMSETQGGFREHFARTLAGEPKSLTEVVSNDFEREVLKLLLGTVWFDSKHTLAPGLSSIKAIFAKAKLKAIGEDLLGGELLRCAAAEIAKIVHPLFVKIFETSWIPTQMRGGHLLAI